MLFNSPQFLIFFPLTTLLYFLFPKSKRWLILLISSILFYMAFIPQYILVLFFLIIVDYLAGLKIYNARRNKKLYLCISLVCNLGILFVFKYFNFFTENITFLSGGLIKSPILNLILPLGLSFHVFQSMSYTIEIYLRRFKPEKHLGYYALFVMFYPQLVAGPIERPQHLLPQLHKESHFNTSRVFDGLKLILWGLFKKMVIADRIAVLINPIFNQPSSYNGITLLTIAYLFSYQIYCDFSGYSDIAIGSAQVLGIELTDNFNRPYFSKSLSEFWQRWHISLSSWFRDYLYIPLGGNRVRPLFWCLNILIVFFLSGLWHGSNWKYILWGLTHGLLLIGSVAIYKFRKKILNLSFNKKIGEVISILVTFNLVSLAWIFFRSNNIYDAFYIFKKIFTSFKFEALSYNPKELTTVLFMIIFLEVVHLSQNHNKIRSMFSDKPIIFRWSFYYLLIFLIIFFGQFKQIQFIYFQF